MTITAPERAPGPRPGVRQGPKASMFQEPVELARPRLTWLFMAMCQYEDPELFYDCESAITREKARAVCLSCPVMEECLEAAMAEEAVLGDTPLQNERYRFGVRGGLTSGERWVLAYPDAAELKRQREEAKRERRNARNAAKRAEAIAAAE